MRAHALRGKLKLWPAEALTPDLRGAHWTHTKGLIMSSNEPNYPYNSQQPYGSQPFPGQMPAYGVPGSQQAVIQAHKDAQMSWVLGLIGLFVALGFVLGPMAIHYANRAERVGVKATLGRVLGWLCVIEFVLIVVFVGLGVVLYLTN